MGRSFTGWATEVVSTAGSAGSTGCAPDLSLDVSMPLRSLFRPVLLLAVLAGLTLAAHAQSDAPPLPLELEILGSGGPGAVGRAASSHVLRLDGVPRILVDAGPGAFARAGEAHIPLARIRTLLLTHLHADHAGDLPGLLKAAAVSGRGPIPVRIFGPGGRDPYPATGRFVELLFGAGGAFAYLPDFSAPLKLTVSELSPPESAPITVFDEDGLRITAVRGHHGEAPAVAYRIDYRGRSIVFSGDMDEAGLPALVALAQDADLLVFNSVVLDPPDSPAVLYTLHSPPAAIGRAAAEARVGRLLLAHIVPAVETHSEAVLDSIRQHFKGPVEVAHDLQRLTPGAP